MKKLLVSVVLAGLASVAFAESRPIYLMVAPHDLYDSLSWYVDQRRQAHPEVDFAIVDTKTIYEQIPYGQGGWGNPRNPAESIHKYLRNYRKTNPALKYVVLGGCWYDATNFKGKGQVYFQNDNSPVTLDNAIPGIFCPFLSSLGGAYPTDMFYGCLEEKGAYPWDADGDGQYMGEEECREKKVDVIPEVSVARLSFIPRPEFKRADGTMLNQHEMITNFVAKLARAEAPDFAGRAKYGTEGSWVVGSNPNSAGDMDRQEFEFYDFAPNMGDPRSATKHGDEEGMSRRDLKNIAAKHPILQCKTLNDSTKTARGKTYANVSTDFFHSDMDYAWVYSHGWALGGSYFTANAFSSHNGLLKFMNACIPCETGMVDYYQSSNGKTYINWCLGSSGLMSPNGGFLASVCNSRYGMDGESAVNGLKWFMDQHFAHNHETAGEAWLNTIKDQYAKYASKAPWMVQRNCGVLIFHGDPLVKMTDEEDVTLSNATWDQLQVVKNATISVPNLAITNQVAMMSANLTGSNQLSISGAAPHEFRVMDNLTAPAGADFTIAAMGGVGKGVVFSGGAKGKLTLNTPDYFYLGGLTNATELALTGHGAVVEAGDLMNVDKLSFAGTSREGAPNILRSRTKGALRSFPTLALSNTAVELQIYEPFDGATEPVSIALDNADLIVGQNPYWGLSGYGQTLSGALTLANGSKLTAKTTKEVSLNQMAITSTGENNAITAASGGVYNLKGTTTITIAPGTTFTLNAEFKDAGSGKLVFVSPDATAANPAKVDFTRATIAGAIELGDNVKLADPEVVTLDASETDLYAAQIPAGTKYFFPNQAESPWEIGVGGALQLGATFFANSETQYVFYDNAVLDDEEPASITTEKLSIVGDTFFLLPLTVNQLVITGDFGCSEVLTCPEVIVEEGGTYTLVGEIKGNIVLRDRAILKATLDGLNWNAGSTMTWEGEVRVDVSEIETILAAQKGHPLPLITGDAHRWTVDDLKSFTVLTEGVVLRLGEDGSLMVEMPENLISGPYTRTISSATVAWDTAEWDNFTTNWSASDLDLTASALVTTTVDTVFAVDTRVALKSLVFATPELSEGATAPSLTLDATRGSFEVVDIDCTAYAGALSMTNATLVGRLQTAPKTTFTSVSGAKVLVQQGHVLTITDPLNCKISFDPASQGCVYVRDTGLKAHKMELFPMASAPISGFEFFAIKEDGSINSAVELYYEEESGKICSRPLGGLKATVSANANFTALSWTNGADESVEVTDWSQVEEVVLTVSGNRTINLDAAPTVKLNVQGSGALTIAATGDASVKLPTILAIDGATLKVEGDILPNLNEAKGTGTLVLATGARTNYPMTVIECPANGLGGGISIQAGSAFAAVFSSNMNFWERGSWGKLSGNGKLIFDTNNGTKYRVFSPMNTWGGNLSFACYVELLYPYHGSTGTTAQTYTYRFKDLEGNAQIGIEPGNNVSLAQVYYEITQTTTTTWSGIPEYIRMSSNNAGTFHQFVVKGNGSADARLIYTGQCPINQPYVSGTTGYPEWAATWNHTFTVDATGVLELNGRWSGDLVNNGLVLIGPNAELYRAGNSPTKLAINGRVGAGSDGICHLTQVSKGDGLKYEASVPGKIRFAVNDLYTKGTVCAITAIPSTGVLTLEAVDPKGNTATRVVTAKDITGTYGNYTLNWRGPSTAPKVLFK